MTKPAESLGAVTVTTVAADLSTDTASPADQASELVPVKVLAPTMLTRAAVPGMLQRHAGTIINVAGT